MNEAKSASERERLLMLLDNHCNVGGEYWRCKCGRGLVDLPNFHTDHLADAILAAGFGDKAAAWDEGLEVGGSNYGEGYGETNPYRTAGTP